jgi:hypothetical protein
MERCCPLQVPIYFIPVNRFNSSRVSSGSAYCGREIAKLSMGLAIAKIEDFASLLQSQKNPIILKSILLSFQFQLSPFHQLWPDTLRPMEE